MPNLKFRAHKNDVVRNDVEITDRPDLVSAFAELAVILGGRFITLRVIKNATSFTFKVSAYREVSHLIISEETREILDRSERFGRLAPAGLGAAALCVHAIGVAIPPVGGSYGYRPEVKKLG